MEPKWQRIRFMPATPLGADGARVTGCEAHIALFPQSGDGGHGVCSKTKTKRSR